VTNYQYDSLLPYLLSILIGTRNLPLIADNPRPHPDPHAIPPTTQSCFPFDPAKTQSGHFVAKSSLQSVQCRE
jgi:hypothetical protein